MSWRPAKSLTTFHAELHKRYPKRDTRSDGTLGDAAHSSRSSKHNPNSADVVTATDVDEDTNGVDGGNDRELWPLVQWLLKLARSGHPALAGPGAHLIYEGRIWSHARGWAERAYTGSNAHKHHLHVAVVDAAAGYDSTRPWDLHKADPAKASPKPDRWLGLANPPMVGNDVRDVHNALIRLDPANRTRLGEDYNLKRYGSLTANLLHRFKTNRSIDERGCGPQCWARLRQDAR